MNQSTLETRYLRIPSASQYLGISEKTLYKYAEERRIPHIKKGGRIFFDMHDLDKWMAKDKVQALAVWENEKKFA